MKTLGLIGGTTWISSIDYYRAINEMVAEHLGGSHSARCLFYSFDFQDIADYIERSDWIAVKREFLIAAKILEAAGADCILFCANTAHVAAENVRNNISVPLIHIGEATVAEVQHRGIATTVGLLGTRFTMEMDYIKEKFVAANIEVLIPDLEDREFIHHSIFEELGKNIFKDETKQRYQEIIAALASRGAEGIILGCTEIPLLIKQSDVDLPVFNTTLIHAKAAVDFALPR
ncbi:MAG: aspartate/glutamate racemase family protein [Bacteriovoracaceae bacterium]|nr:aspartate/glutamate racemase family protein [Bacteroidota bacterium]